MLSQLSRGSRNGCVATQILRRAQSRNSKLLPGVQVLDMFDVLSPPAIEREIFPLQKMRRGEMHGM